ncbi:aspartyl/asparaginyl beta-hydroxylase domain-containing protein [Micromonospora craterilacus]|nr:aspartyl/asparaginyl beta-hydroxylase domain-containing protein [Micromonospora craterilacus]
MSGTPMPATDGPSPMRALGWLLLGHLARYRTAKLQDLATATLRDAGGRGTWVVPTLNATIRIRHAGRQALYLRPRQMISRIAASARTGPAVPAQQISVLCPTRDRPAGLYRLLTSMARTAVDPSRIEILCYVDSDDPRLAAYRRLAASRRLRRFARVVLHVGPPVGVPPAWNTLAELATGGYLAMANDDQLYVDHGWDVALDRRVAQVAQDHPDRVACLYFDAGQYPDGGCDFPIVSRDWYATLGYYAPELFQQWQAERWIFDLARRIDRLYPIPGIFVDHLHYQDYKAPFDATYQRHRMTREKSLADQALFIRTAPERARAAELLRRAMTADPARIPGGQPSEGPPMAETIQPVEPPPAHRPAPARTDDTGTRQYILQTARRYYGNLIDAWHYGGRPEEARACADLAVEQGVWEHPLQRAREHVPGLRATPLHDPDDFWFVGYLEEHYPQIRAEIEQVLDRPADPVRPTTDDNALIRRGEWKQAHLFRDGQWQEDVCRHFPAIRAILAQIPEVTTFNPGVITVSRVEPGTHIMPHCGPTNALLRVHLPIRIPPGVWLRVADHTTVWQEGRCLVFDDSFEHEVGHDGTQDRVVLILDTLHPDLGGDHRARLLQRRLTTEEQIIAFLRDGGFTGVAKNGDHIVLQPEPGLRDMIQRYMRATGIDGVELRGDDVIWHRADDKA